MWLRSFRVILETEEVPPEPSARRLRPRPASPPAENRSLLSRVFRTRKGNNLYSSRLPHRCVRISRENGARAQAPIVKLASMMISSIFHDRVPDILQTRVYRLFRPAHLAFDLAAPVEGAGAPLDYRHLLRLVAPAAAHQVAAVDADARLVALPPVGAQDPEFRVLLAEGRRRLHVDEVLRPGRLVLRIVRLQLEVVAMPASQAVAMMVHGVARRVAGDGVVVAHAVRIADHHSGGPVEAILQVVADHAEVRQSHPAGFHRARARHAVALALLTHLRGHVLQRKARSVRYFSPSFRLTMRLAIE